jgi:hypothetical protein
VFCVLFLIEKQYDATLTLQNKDCIGKLLIISAINCVTEFLPFPFVSYNRFFSLILFISFLFFMSHLFHFNSNIVGVFVRFCEGAQDTSVCWYNGLDNFFLLHLTIEALRVLPLLPRVKAGNQFQVGHARFCQRSCKLTIYDYFSS